MSTAAGVPPVHDLLLGLAGRVDDDLLAWARELLAVGEDDQAVELATAAVAAERLVLPSTLRAALVAAARAAHTDLDVDRALPPGSSEAAMPHRFDATAGSGDAVAAALTALPARRLAGCTVHLTWRRTPAGGAPGPVPHPVVLVEVDPERSAEVLAHVLATELERAGAPASVEVFTAGVPLPGYHTAALRSAHTVVRRQPDGGPEDGGRPGAGEDPPADEAGTAEEHLPAGERGPLDERSDVAPARAADGEGVDLPVGEAARPDAGRPDARDAEDPGDRPERREGTDPTPTPLFLVPALDAPHTSGAAASGAPAPAGWSFDEPHRNGSPADAGARPLAGRRRRADPIPPDTAGPGTPVDPAGTGTPPEDVPQPAPVAPTEPALDTDPLRGPLRTPLLAPLLDPTGPDEPPFDPLELPRREARGAAGEPAPAAPSPHQGGGGELPAEWEEDWRSGDWAMPHQPRPAPVDHASDGQHDGRVDVVGSDEFGAAPPPDGPSPFRRIGELPQRPAERAPHAGGHGETATRDSGHVPLFDPPAAGADPQPYPAGSRRMPDATPDGESPPPAPAPGPPLPKRSKDGPRAPFGRSDDPLFGPLDRDRLLFDDTFRGQPEPPLFGDASIRERRLPDGPPMGGVFGRADRAPAEEPPPADRAGVPEPDRAAPRPGRRRRPEENAVDLPPASAPQPPPQSSPPPSTPTPQSPPMPHSPSAPRPAGPTDPAGPTPGTAPTGSRAPGPRPPEPRPAEPGADVPWPPPPSSPDFEPSRLLHGTERDLLSQLQAELSTPERRPRPYRRAGRPGPTGTVNGHGHSPAPDGERPPPDMAG